MRDSDGKYDAQNAALWQHGYTGCDRVMAAIYKSTTYRSSQTYVPDQRKLIHARERETQGATQANTAAPPVVDERHYCCSQDQREPAND